jgi:integrase
VEIDTSGEMWQLADPSQTAPYIDLSELHDGTFKHALKLFLCHAIASFSPRGTCAVWGDTKRVLRAAPSVPVALEDLTLEWWEFTRHRLQEMDSEHKRAGEPRLAFARQWFLWMADNEFPGVDDDVAFAIENWSIRGCVKGELVSSRDPDQGPLKEREFAALIQLIRKQQPVSLGQAATALCVELGPNAKNICFLEERDLRVFTDPADSSKRRYQLDVLRIKKRLAHRQTKRRPISAYLGVVLENLIEENRRRFGGVPDPKRPILCRLSVRGDNLHESLRSRFQWHPTSGDIYFWISRYAESNQLRAPGDDPKRIIHLTPRRLRYTFACRLAAAGAPKRLIAEALDHSDLQHVGVYVEVSGKLAGRLTEAFDAQMGPLVDLFMGRILKTESDGVAFKENARIQGRGLKGELLPGIGLCGSSSMCRLHPPLTCYACDHFQPLKSGPHEKSLELAQELRKRYVSADGSRNEGLVTIDRAIVRIQAVIEAAKRLGE